MCLGWHSFVCVRGGRGGGGGGKGGGGGALGLRIQTGTVLHKSASWLSVFHFNLFVLNLLHVSYSTSVSLVSFAYPFWSSINLYVLKRIVLFLL